MQITEGEFFMDDLKRRKRSARKLRRLRRCIWLCAAALGLIAVLHIAGSRTGTGRQQTVTARQERSWEQKDVPESLIELAERNPETITFVNDYKNADINLETIDISDDVVSGEIPLFLQWDERWGYAYYGDDFMAITGCGPTCLAMVYCGLANDTDMNPYAVAERAEAEGFYVEGSGSTWSMMTDLAKELGLTVNTVTFDETHIKTELQNGHPVICIMGPGDFTTTGHFIVLTGVDEDGSVHVNDPNSRNNSKKAWKLENIMPQIRNLWSYCYNS